MLCCAGECITIPAGHWYVMNFPFDSCYVLDHRWLSLSSAVQGLYMTYRIKSQRDKRWEFKSLVPGNLKLREPWMHLVEASAARWNDDVLHPFTFAPPVAGGAGTPSMSLKASYTPTGLASQKEKWGELQVLASLAREAVEQVGKGKLLFDHSRDINVTRRGWGRLTKWIQGHCGRTGYQKEHDITLRGGKRPSKRAKGGATKGEEEESSDEEPSPGPVTRSGKKLLLTHKGEPKPRGRPRKAQAAEDSDRDVADPEREDLGEDEEVGDALRDLAAMYS
jgi:hypothetical protein